MLRVETYFRPREVDDVLRQLAAGGGTVLAGGSDLFAGDFVERVRRPLIDISAVPEMAGISIDGNVVRIGGATPWREISHSALPSAFDGLKAAARMIGPIQVQNRGTIGGNLCTASPAADGVPPLLSLGAEVELLSLAGPRRLPLENFILGNRKTALRPDEMVSAVLVRVPTRSSTSSFVKFGGRRDSVISTVMVAVHIEWSSEDTAVEAGIAVGAASEVARRLKGLEARLRGARRGAISEASILPDDIDCLLPITDVRATREFRFHIAQVLAGRALVAACEAHSHA